MVSSGLAPRGLALTWLGPADLALFGLASPGLASRGFALAWLGPAGLGPAWLGPTWLGSVSLRLSRLLWRQLGLAPLVVALSGIGVATTRIGLPTIGLSGVGCNEADGPRQGGLADWVVRHGQHWVGWPQWDRFATNALAMINGLATTGRVGPD